MDAQKVANSPKKLYWYLGDGGLLALFWWGLALANDPFASAHFWPGLVTALGGFILAIPSLILIVNSRPVDPQRGKSASLWQTLSLSYPLALLGLFIWNQFSASPVGWLGILTTHPAILTINLTASLLIGSILNHNSPYINKEAAMAIWWLWQLPLIFINGSVLLQYNFSNLLMFLYLATVLGLSFVLSWHSVKKVIRRPWA